MTSHKKYTTLKEMSGKTWRNISANNARKIMCAVDPRFIAEGGWTQGETGRETFKIDQRYGSL